MNVDMGVINAIVGIMASALLTGVAYIFRTLAKQNETMSKQSNALALVVHQVGTFNPGVVDGRLNNLEADQARVWVWKEHLDRAGVGKETV